MLKSLLALLGRQPEDYQANVEIYTWQTCPFCIRAKMLLGWKGVKFTEYKIDGDEAAREEMAKRAHGHRSVPEIFINNEHIGGCDELYALDKSGELDKRLMQPADAVG
ncbi:MAG: glutaredoxin 3 [Halothece sp. Uz-M2-17]|nr:glutaredoxin 3 [Halothece sp. Uz-M2-17]